MKMKKIFLLPIIILVCMLKGCEPPVQNGLIGHTLSYTFIPYKCNYLIIDTADNAEKVIALSQYKLHIITSHVPDSMRYKSSLFYYDVENGNGQIEADVKRHLHKRYFPDEKRIERRFGRATRPAGDISQIDIDFKEGMMNFYSYVYSVSVIKDLKVTASADLCGVKAGHSLNHLMDVSVSRMPFITRNRAIFEGVPPIMSIERYLAYSPATPQGEQAQERMSRAPQYGPVSFPKKYRSLSLLFKPECRLSESVDVQFTVSFELEDGRVISTVSDLITLQP